jgi:hypothetical protein
MNATAPAGGNGAGPAQLVLIELNLDRLSGHWAEYVPALARAARDWDGPVAFVGGGTAADDIRQQLSGCELVLLGDQHQRRRGFFFGMAAAADWVYRLPIFNNGRARMPRRQIALVRRCCTEVGVLRGVRRRWGSHARVVLLTSSEGLAVTAAALSGTPHVRVVHELRYVEGPIIATIERLLRRYACRVVQVSPAASVEAQMLGKAVPTRTAVRPFSLKDPTIYLTDQERVDARRELGLSDTETVGCYLGGWWPGKDWTTAITGISRSSKVDTMIIAGDPIDPALVDWLRAEWGGRLHTILRPLTSEEFRRCYAASDFTMVCRHAGVTKESGLVMDAVRYGVHLVTTDHDPHLAAHLRQYPWATVYRCGDPDALAQALDAMTVGIARPDPGDRDTFGTYSALETLHFFADLANDLTRS